MQLWKDAVKTKARSPYLSHELPGKHVGAVRCCPYEDVVGVSPGAARRVCVPGLCVCACVRARVRVRLCVRICACMRAWLQPV